MHGPRRCRRRCAGRPPRRTADEIAFLRWKELFYAILATERRRDAINAQIRAAIDLRTLWRPVDAVDTGVALEMKCGRSWKCIRRSRRRQHALGQLQDAVSRYRRKELTDLYRAAARYGFRTGCAGRTCYRPPRRSALELCAHERPWPYKWLSRTTRRSSAVGHQDRKGLRAGVKAARAEYIPEVGVFAQLTCIQENGAPFVSRNNGVVGLNLKWTVFEFGKRRGQVSERSGGGHAQAEENLAQVRQSRTSRRRKGGSAG